jgi:hypothetical protein
MLEKTCHNYTSSEKRLPLNEATYLYFFKPYNLIKIPPLNPVVAVLEKNGSILFLGNLIIDKCAQFIIFIVDKRPGLAGETVQNHRFKLEDICNSSIVKSH